jgi:hypothetical protein
MYFGKKIPHDPKLVASMIRLKLGVVGEKSDSK